MPDVSEPLVKAAKPVAARDVLIGKDMLELVSTAMYLDPMAIYREYIQNAADSIDDAVRQGLLLSTSEGRVDIEIDDDERRITIRDNGTGVAHPAFAARMTSLGGSAKRGSSARGFRGVGRLSALGCAHELVFRSRVPGQSDVSEIRWDCRKLKSALSDARVGGSVADLVADIVTLGTITAKGRPDRFFEVELVKVVRQRNDKLMDVRAVSDYLSQVAPVPFSAKFPHAEAIASRVGAVAPVSEIEIRINEGEVLTRPHGEAIDLGQGKLDPYGEIEFLEVLGVDGGVAALGWFVHHDYNGALPTSALVKGIRLRAGNLQVGGHDVLETIFPEPRFNSWSVGEVHILDKRIVPNGRRDNFEQNTHLTNLLNKLSPIGRDIASQCRVNSARRSRLRQFELAEEEVAESIKSLRADALGKSARKATISRARMSIERMEELAEQRSLVDEAPQLTSRIDVAQTKLAAVANEKLTATNPLDALPARDRAAYERVFALILQHLSHRNAKALIEKIGQGLIAS